MEAQSNPIPRKLHRSVVRICAEFGAPPYWWEIPAPGVPAPTDWKVARAIVVGIASSQGFTRDELGMSGVSWRDAKAIWGEFSAFERKLYSDVSGMQSADFRDYIQGDEGAE